MESGRDRENTITNITLKSQTKKSMMPLKSKKKMRSTSKTDTMLTNSVPSVPQKRKKSKTRVKSKSNGRNSIKQSTSNINASVLKS